MSDESETLIENSPVPSDEAPPQGDDEGLMDDEDLDDDEFDDDLLATAKMVGLNPNDYEDPEELRTAAESKIRQLERAALSPGDEKSPEKLELTALEMVLSTKDDLDPGLVTALEKLASASGKNFERLAAELTARGKSDQDVSARIDRISKSVAVLTAQNVQLRLDRWIAGRSEAQAYLGKGDTGELKADEKHARRRRSLVRRAESIAGRTRGDFTMEEMFVKALRKMNPAGKKSSSAKGSAGTDSESSVTRVAQPSGSRTDQLPPAEVERSRAQTLNKAALVVGKYRRNSK